MLGGVSQSTLWGHLSVSDLKGRENWGLVGNRALHQGGMSINRVFL